MRFAIVTETMSKITRLAVAAVLVMVMVLSACTEATPSSETSAAATTEPAETKIEQESDEAPSQDPPAAEVATQQDDDPGDVPPIGPMGIGDEVFAPRTSVFVREGESRTVTVSVRGFDASGVWTLSDVTSSDAVSLTSKLPPSLDFSASDEFSLDVEVTAASFVGGVPEQFGDFVQIGVSPPASVDVSFSTSIGVYVVVVPVSEPVGPGVTGDWVVVPESGSVNVDVLANDSAGDAALDPGSLEVFDLEVAVGTEVTVEVDGSISYDATISGNSTARYRVCDVGGLCGEGQLTFIHQ